MNVGLATRVRAADAAVIEEAAQILRAGGLVAFPTETVYGLGADATNAVAVARLFAAKGRPSFNPLIAHVLDAAAARTLGRLDENAERLATLWPGPLTLVLPKLPACPVAELATAGLDTIAVRAPSHPVARALLAKIRGPIVAPSANRSGHVSPTTAEHVRADLAGQIDLIIDGGATPRRIGIRPSLPASAPSHCCCGPAACRAPRSSAPWAGPSPAAVRCGRGRRCAARARHAVVALRAAHALASGRDQRWPERSPARVWATVAGGGARPQPVGQR